MSKWSKWNMVCCRTMTHVLTVCIARTRCTAPLTSMLCPARCPAHRSHRAAQESGMPSSEHVGLWVLFKIRPSMRAALPRPARITPQGVWTCVQHVVSSE